jgi:hypothetical protein
VERDHCVAAGARIDPFSHPGTDRWFFGFHPRSGARRWRRWAGGRRRRRDEWSRLARGASTVHSCEIRSHRDAQTKATDGSSGEAAGAEAASRVASNTRSPCELTGDDDDQWRGKRQCRDPGRWSRYRGRSRIRSRRGSREQRRTRHGRRTRPGLPADASRSLHSTATRAGSDQAVPPHCVVRCRREGELQSHLVQSVA